MRASLRYPTCLAALSAALLTACGLATPGAGTPVAPGVARADFEVRVGSTDLVDVRVLFPSDALGAPLPGTHPGLVFIQGGFVKPERYLWQAEALAREGYVVAVPEHFLDLAFFGVEVGAAARTLLVQPPPGSVLVGAVDPARVAVAGHSLGGVVALKLALAGGFQAVVVEASFPDGADVPALASFTLPSLSLAGELDCSAPLAGVRNGWNTLPSPTALAVLTGVTHFQFTNADTEDVQRKCPPVSTLADAHEAITRALTTFLGPALEGRLDAAGLQALPRTTVEIR